MKCYCQRNGMVKNFPVKFSFKDKFEFEKLEKEIEVLEKEKSTLMDWMNAGNGTHDELMGWANRLVEVNKLVDEKSMRWLELNELHN